MSHMPCPWEGGNLSVGQSRHTDQRHDAIWRSGTCARPWTGTGGAPVGEAAHLCAISVCIECLSERSYLVALAETDREAAETDRHVWS